MNLNSLCIKHHVTYTHAKQRRSSHVPVCQQHRSPWGHWIPRKQNPQLGAQQYTTAVVQGHLVTLVHIPYLFVSTFWMLSYLQKQRGGIQPLQCQDGMCQNGTQHSLNPETGLYHWLPRLFNIPCSTTLNNIFLGGRGSVKLSMGVQW